MRALYKPVTNEYVTKAHDSERFIEICDELLTLNNIIDFPT